MEKDWCFYLISNGGATYAGISPDPMRRLRCHNGELSGGAKYTTSKGPGWMHICILWGFDKISAMKFEWAVKHNPVASGKRGRVEKMVDVMNRDRWTSKSDLSSSYELKLRWYEDEIYDCLLNVPETVKIMYENKKDDIFG